jgi:Flp pilus assembly protein TadG
MKHSLVVPVMVKQIASDDSGLALIEFAFTVPILLALLVGGSQLTNAIAAQRKVTTTTRALADLTTQYTSVSNDDLDQILAASQKVMAPYDVSNAQLLISEVYTDKNGSSKVVWSRPLNGGSLPIGSDFTVPATIKQNNTSLIVASVNFTYTLSMGSPILGTIPMKDVIIMSPRGSPDIPMKTQ